MSRVITFSRTFPKYHPMAGQQTMFVEKILKSFEDTDWYGEYIYNTGERLGYMYADEMLFACDNAEPKHHTIRAGHNWKVGDKFSPRVWSGIPYKSQQIIIAPDIEIKKVWDFEVAKDGFYHINSMPKSYLQLKILAANDGFDNLDDFELWFNLKKDQTFSGQIICWNDKIEY